MSTEPNPLRLSLKIELSSKVDNYSWKEIVDLNCQKSLVLNSDASKRKILDEVENNLNDLIREAAKLIHSSSNLTDGEIDRKKEEVEKYATQ